MSEPSRLRLISWNVFHGRDAPPDPALFTLRSRLLGIAERNEHHVQLNRDLYREYATLLARWRWDIALLQEFPPRWADPIAADCAATAHAVSTSRNFAQPLRSALARANPDLLGANEGGSNAILVRGAPITERRALVLRTGRPERRTMAFARTGAGIAVACLHATNDRPELASEQVLAAAATAVEWAGPAPLVFGGDLNLRPDASPELFAELARSHGLSPPTGPAAIDHILVRGISVIEPPRQLPAAERELPDSTHGELAIRLSDHAPVACVCETASRG